MVFDNNKIFQSILLLIVCTHAQAAMIKFINNTGLTSAKLGYALFDAQGKLLEERNDVPETLTTNPVATQIKVGLYEKEGKCIIDEYSGRCSAYGPAFNGYSEVVPITDNETYTITVIDYKAPTKMNFQSGLIKISAPSIDIWHQKKLEDQKNAEFDAKLNKSKDDLLNIYNYLWFIRFCCGSKPLNQIRIEFKYDLENLKKGISNIESTIESNINSNKDLANRSGISAIIENLRSDSAVLKKFIEDIIQTNAENTLFNDVPFNQQQWKSFQQKREAPTQDELKKFDEQRKVNYKARFTNLMKKAKTGVPSRPKPALMTIEDINSGVWPEYRRELQQLLQENPTWFEEFKKLDY